MNFKRIFRWIESIKINEMMTEIIKLNDKSAFNKNWIFFVSFSIEVSWLLNPHNTDFVGFELNNS